MGNFQDSLKKWFFTNSSSAATSTCRIPLLDASGNPIGSDTPNNILKNSPVTVFTGNVGVATLESNYPRFRQPDEVASYTSVAVGVWVQEAGRLIVVAKNEQASTQWATSNVSGGNTPISDREAAMLDFNGRSNTSTAYTTLGSNSPAMTYAKGYYPSNVANNDGYFGAGRWWLPSAGELWMIWSHLLEINRIMSAIGGTQLSRSVYYWSSTEYSATYAWYLVFGNGIFHNGGSKTDAYSVRPVSAFY